MPPEKQSSAGGGQIDFKTEYITSIPGIIKIVQFVSSFLIVYYTAPNQEKCPYWWGWRKQQLSRFSLRAKSELSASLTEYKIN